MKRFLYNYFTIIIIFVGMFLILDEAFRRGCLDSRGIYEISPRTTYCR